MQVKLFKCETRVGVEIITQVLAFSSPIVTNEMNIFTILILLDVLYQVTSHLAVVTNKNSPLKNSVILNLAPTSTQTPVYFSSVPTVTKLQSKPHYGNNSNLLQPRNIVDILKSPIEQLLDYLIGTLYVINNIIKNQQSSATLTGPEKPPRVIFPKAIEKPVEKIFLAPVIKKENPIPKNNINKSPILTPIKQSPPPKPIVKKPIQSMTKKPSFPPDSTNFKNSILFSYLGDLIGLGDSSSDPLINAKIADRIPTQQPGVTVTVEGKNNSIYIDNMLRYPNDEIFKNDHEVRIRIRSGDFYVNNNLVLKKGRSDHDHVFYSTHELKHRGVSYFVLKIYSNGTLQYHDNKVKAQSVNYYTPVLSLGSNKFNFF
ncbi:uncharacterized protein LOC135848287 [Planococcus citri]|uniref:uncharacterized protein LOC135848287 n=1 Tax=Planococcus citri TaxID=170843 RepID=UPI0031F86248